MGPFSSFDQNGEKAFLIKYNKNGIKIGNFRPKQGAFKS